MRIPSPTVAHEDRRARRGPLAPSLRTATETPRGNAPVPGFAGIARLAKAAGFAILVLGWPLVSTATPSPRVPQESAFDGWDEVVDPGYRHDPDGSRVATFAVQSSARARFLAESAEDAMRRGDFKAAAEPLQELINLHPTHLVQVADQPAARYVGAAEYAKYLLGSLPPEGRAAYTEYARLRSASTWRVLEKSIDADGLLAFAKFWELTPEGQDSLERLGRLAFERGDFGQAGVCFGRRLAFEDPPGERAAEIAFLAGASAAARNDRTRASNLLDRFGDGTVMLGGDVVSSRAGLDRLFAAAPRETASWRVVGGDNTHSLPAVFDPGAISFVSRWEAPSFSEEVPNPWLRGMSSRDAFPFHAVVDGDFIVVADGLSVRAFSFYSFVPKWEFDGPLAAADFRGFYTFEDLLNESARSDTDDLGALASQLPLSATIASGRVVVPLLEPVPKLNTREIEFDRTKITSVIPRRSLHAIDLETGHLLWRQRRDELPAQDFSNLVSIVAPPVVVGDRVYAAGYVLEGAINVYVVCLSLDDGRLLWKTPLLIGQQELTMFNKPFKEFTLQMLAESEGALFVSTNLGLVGSLDALSGNPRWMAEYKAIPITGTNHYRRTNERDIYWTNDPPLVKDGVVVFTPLDSESAWAFDAATGKPLWDQHVNKGVPSRVNYCSLLGVDQGVVVFGGLNGIGFHDLKTGKLLASPVAFAQVGGGDWSGRGCLAPGVVYQPLSDGLLKLSFKNLGAVGVETVETEVIDWGCDSPGNLLLHRDFQVVLSPEAMTVYYDLDDLISRVRDRIASGGAVPADHIDLGELLAMQRRHDLALAEFELARDAPEAAHADVRRANERISVAHGELAAAAEEADDLPSAVAHRFAEAEHAIDNSTFLHTAEKLVRLLERSDPSRIDSVLDWIDRRCPDALHVFAASDYGGEIPAGLYALDQRAAYALGRNDPNAAVASWQRMIEAHRSQPFFGVTAGSYARKRIAELIERQGRDAYLQFDALAEAARVAAVASENAAGLQEAIERYPNAASTARARLDLANLRLSRGENSDVFRVIAPLITGGGGSGGSGGSGGAVGAGSESGDADRKVGLLLASRAAAAAGDTALARLILARLVKDSATADVPFEPGADVRSAAERDLAALGAGEPPGARELLLPDLPASSFARLAVTAARVSLVPVAFDRQDAVLLYQEALPGDDDATLRRIDLATLQATWHATIPAYANAIDPLKAFAIGDRIVLHQRDRLLAFDERTGAPRFQTTFDSKPMAVASAGSLIYALLSPPYESPSTVVAVETATGMALWSRQIALQCASIQATDDLIVAVGATEAVVTVLDALTGETRYQLSDLEITGVFDARAYPAYGVLLMLGRVGAKKVLAGFDLADGRPLFRQQNDIPQNLTFEWLTPFGDVMLVPNGGTPTLTRSAQGVFELLTLEPRTGHVESIVSKLDLLKSFDHGTGLARDRFVMIATSPSPSRKSEPDRFVVISPAAGQVERTVEIAGMPRATTRYRGLPTAAGDLYGIIDVSKSMRSVERAYLFTYAVATGTFQATEIPTASEGIPTQIAVTSRHVAVLRGTTLYSFEVRSTR